MRICADAVPDDGLFDVTVVGDCSRATLLKVFPQVYKGTRLGHPRPCASWYDRPTTVRVLV